VPALHVPFDHAFRGPPATGLAAPRLGAHNEEYAR
jgi:hypothetical protein